MEELLKRLDALEAAMRQLAEQVEQNTTQLGEFFERFEEGLERLESERRSLDWQDFE